MLLPLIFRLQCRDSVQSLNVAGTIVKEALFSLTDRHLKLSFNGIDTTIRIRIQSPHAVYSWPRIEQRNEVINNYTNQSIRYISTQYSPRWHTPLPKAHVTTQINCLFHQLSQPYTVTFRRTARLTLPRSPITGVRESHDLLLTSAESSRVIAPEPKVGRYHFNCAWINVNVGAKIVVMLPARTANSYTTLVIARARVENILRMRGVCSAPNLLM